MIRAWRKIIPVKPGIRKLAAPVAGEPRRRVCVPAGWAGKADRKRGVLLLVLLLATGLANAGLAHASRATLALHENWQFRLLPGSSQMADHPEARHWLPARIPGEVHTDLLAAKLIPDPFVGAPEAGLQWIGLADWEYRTTFDLDAKVLEHRHLDLVFEGLDTFAEVTLNGERILGADNMHRRWRVPAKRFLRARNNELRVILHSPIHRVLPRVLAQPRNEWLPGNYTWPFDDEPKGAQTSNYVRKAHYHYGWDWGPRYVTAGIWRPVKLEAWDDLRIDDLHIRQQRIDADIAQLQAELEIESDHAGSSMLSLGYRDPDGKQHTAPMRKVQLAAGRNRISFPLVIEAPRRWFPVGYGEQALYTFSAKLGDAEATRRSGLRSIELKRERDQWGRGMAFIVNGIPIFAKGANTIPFDSFANRVDRARYEKVMRTARDDNMNMLRVWGGGYYESDDFYDLADELGLLVWQDFMFGGGVPPADDPAFRANVVSEAVDQLRRLRHHPSIVLWCGNNEIEAGWKSWGDRQTLKKQAPQRARQVWAGYVQLFGKDLPAAVANHADVPYWSSSPGTNLEGDVDVADDGDRHFWAVWGGEPIEEYLDETPRFMSEYGLQSFPVMRTVLAFAALEDLHVDSPVIRAHQKYDNGNGNQRILKYIRENYGEPKDFESFVYLSQVMQAEGIELAALHHRSQRPRTMGSLFWQLNDVWPGASWSAIDYYGRRKALSFHSRRFFAPLAIAPIRNKGQTRVALVSDRLVSTDATWRVRSLAFDGKVLSDKKNTVTLPPLSSTVVADYGDAELLRGANPRSTAAVFDLLIDGRNVSRRLIYFNDARDLRWLDPGLKTALHRTDDGYRLDVSAQHLAREVWIDTGDLDIELDDNALTLLPGETATLSFASELEAAVIERQLSVRSLYDAATTH